MPFVHPLLCRSAARQTGLSLQLQSLDEITHCGRSGPVQSQLSLTPHPFAIAAIDLTK